MRLSQKRRQVKSCGETRIGNITLNNKKCGFYEENIWNFTKGNSIYKYIDYEKNNGIKGTFMNYNQSGFQKIISLENPEKFYKDMDKLISENWVDEDTISVLLSYNSYSINNDLFLFFRIIWENQGFYFKRYPSFGLIDNNPINEVYYIISISLSIILILYKIFELKFANSEISINLQKNYLKNE